MMSVKTEMIDIAELLTLQKSSNTNDRTPVMVNTPVAVLQGRAAPANMLRKNPRFKKHDQSTEV